jgi:phage terminase large subunit
MRPNPTAVANAVYKRLFPLGMSDKQLQAFQHIGAGKVVFLGGSRGGGKSAFAWGSCVMKCLKHPRLKAAIIRASKPEIERYFEPLALDLPSNLASYSKQSKIITFYNGSRLHLIGIEQERDTKKIKGAEFQYCVLDESTEFSWRFINLVRGSVRKPVDGFIPTMLLTGNPGGISDLEHKRYFIAPDYRFWSADELAAKDMYVFVPMSVYDNPDEEFRNQYERTLKSFDKDLQSIWLHGNWDSLNGRFFSEWSEAVHVVSPFDVPKEWVRVRGLDLGYGDHETVCLWAAQNPDTEEIFIYREYSGRGVTQEHINNIKHYTPDDEAIVMTCIDPSARIKRLDTYTSESPIDMYLRGGIYCTPAINERQNGWLVVKSWLHHTEENPPKLKFFSTARGCIESLPELVYDKRGKGIDLDTRMRDDFADALRYLLITYFRYPVKPPLTHSFQVREGFEQETTKAVRQEDKPTTSFYSPTYECTSSVYSWYD